MSVAGLKKQFHKASQLFSEKISGEEGTKLDSSFLDMERKIDVTNKAITEILSKTTEYLQPNPAYRARLGMLNTVSKLRGQVKTMGYPQTEGLLGECMLKHGQELGSTSTFGEALVEVGEALKLMADVKDCLDISVKQTFIDPLQLLQEKDLREIGHHLKKLDGRRLDYDYKKKRVGKIPEEEIRQAADKFEESKELAERSMFNFLENDVEQVSQLSVFVEAILDYHRQSSEILQAVQMKLQARIVAASCAPRREYKPQMQKSPSQLSLVPFACPPENTAGTGAPGDRPCCRGLYDFEPENQGELGFREGDIIGLSRQLDENWFEGTLRGESGFFPISYVQVIVPLPQ